MLKWLWLSLIIFILDQSSKLLVVSYFQLHESMPLLPSLNLTYVHNKGAAFSLLSSAGGWQRGFFIGVAIIATTVLVIWLKRLEVTEKWMAVTISLVLGGAIGNLYDRISYGYVIDFIDVYYQAHHWPVFNIADSAISVGVVMMLMDAFWGKKSTTTE
ncbi:MAG TPA: lipoprotein signal peptidase [Cycloclasticus sp.]|jgi:signal peptidase II|nr:lipoprotein signal peptidase [Cycloclasticus sp.]HIL94044.1 lipoprotein signal peptidase [Cycloclasticus sp.]